MIEISVIIPCYNSEKTIERAVRSLLEQTVGTDKFEIIIVDDGSAKPIHRFLDTYQSLVRIITHPRNLGLPSALNTGIRASRGRFIARLDADDYVHVKYLELLKLKFSMTQNTHAVACDYFVVDELENKESEKSFLEQPIGCSIMFRKDLLIKLGLYDEEMLMCEDVDLLDRYAQSYTVSHLALPLYRYTRHAANMTNDDERHLEYFKKAKEKNGLRRRHK